MLSQSKTAATPPMASLAGTERRNREKPKERRAEAGGWAPLPPVRASRLCGGVGGGGCSGTGVPDRAMVASPLYTS